MLAQKDSKPVAVAPGSFLERRNAEMWGKIEAFLSTRRSASTREIAEAIGLSRAATHKRLVGLRELGEVRLVPPLGCSTLLAWALCTETDSLLAHRVAPLITKAVQIGGFRRDPLVAALFGEPRCASCHEPQDEPHREDCAFKGLDIDAAHQPATTRQEV